MSQTTLQPVTTSHTTAPEEALILGLTGGYGGAMAQQLQRRGWRLRALVRDLDRGRAAAERLGLEVTLVQGDVCDETALAQAAAGVTVIVHGVNAPYDRWAELVVPMARAVADAAVREGATILFPGNVYSYAPGAAIGERTPEAPPTAKGALRVQVEAVLAEATERGARLILLRGGDFFGVGHSSSWMSHVLSKAATGGALQVPGREGVRHAWCYLPDFVRAHVDLLDRDRATPGALPADARFHFAGHVLTRAELIDALRSALGDPGRRAVGMPWPVLSVVGWFKPLIREIARMRYLWEEEVLLDDTLLSATLDAVPHTPLADALAAELTALGVPMQRLAA